MPKAFILAAGFGTRLRPLTESMPKALVEVNGTPLIVHHIQALKQAGITEIGINLHYLGKMIRERCGCGQEWGVQLSYFDETEILGTLGGLRAAQSFLDEPFWCVSADIFTHFDFSVPEPHTPGCVYLVDNPDYHAEGDFCIEGDLLSMCGDKLTYANIGYFEPKVFNSMGEGSELGPWLKKAANDHSLYARKLDCLWYNIGTMKELERARQAI